MEHVLSGIGKPDSNDTGWYSSGSAGITNCYPFNFDILGLCCYTESRNILFILMDSVPFSHSGTGTYSHACSNKQREWVRRTDSAGRRLPSVVSRASVHQAKWEMSSSAWSNLDEILMTETWLTDGPTAFKHMDEHRQERRLTILHTIMHNYVKTHRHTMKGGKSRILAAVALNERIILQVCECLWGGAI